MARTSDDIRAYLTKLQRPFEQVDEATFLVAVARNQPPVALRVDSPVAVLQVAICQAPAGDALLEARVFRRLLELNASDLMHASYGVTGGQVYLAAALELDNLDVNELEAVLEDMGLALAEHVPELHGMLKDDMPQAEG